MPLPATETDRSALQRAVHLATTNVAEGGGPFGAVIMRNGETIAEGVNRVTLDLDATAHAEVVAIRAAGRALATNDLSGCTLYSSCEPCPMCMAACLWARLDRVVFAADRNDAAAAGFDDRAFYDYFERPGSTDFPRPEQGTVADKSAPFTAWRANSARTEY